LKHQGRNYQRLAQRNLTALERSPYGFSERLKFALLDQLKQRSRLITLTFLPEPVYQQHRRAAGQRNIERQQTQSIIDQINATGTDIETMKRLIDQLKRDDLPAYKRFMKRYDEGAYNDEFRN
jgi:hypothetical protein